ncbi:uracil-xanthine permease family protein [Candidatus Galacturonibacter soehngenii]|uniref:Uracil-xanthine permease n=1 Tax=Candidatus Galacturonatibacter soehngenii TaxID=2307010 RepID=A0A7V7QNP3_9FIRM|nr:uracil-xanthine permease family protein [Candidatus Galacturonibacter soehngenii]KAB1440410.1 uracil-xanthine permease [Candidatus Galacturonibacter soehngenii]MBA4688932.1 uracil-xanthine permease [Candidatus Galacturonibacter soehngenii]
MDNKKSYNQKIILGIQHVLAMFGATVLVPALTGLNTSITLFCAGCGTLIFHLVSKKKVPVFLGSSFAFMGGIISVIGSSRMGDPDFLEKLATVKGALIVAGLIYVLFAALIKLVGYDKVNKLLPPIVTGPIIIVIGLRLSSSAISSAFYYNNEFSLKAVFVTVIVLTTVICISVFAKGIYNLMPILFAIIIGYIVSIPMGFVNLDPVRNAEFFSFMDSNITTQLFLMPVFKVDAILAIAPIALVTLIEHVGDITTNSAVVGKNFMIDPGVHRTILGDGLATAFAGLLGGPANTTYGENTGVLAVTKNYDPSIIRIAAVFAIILGIFGKIGGLITSIPGPVSGGISIVLYGMISSVGVRILINARLNFGNSRNLMIAALILVLGIGCDSVPVVGTVTISGLALAAIVGMFLAAILPEGKDSILE